MKNEVYNILQNYFANYNKLSILKSENIWEIDETDKNIFLNLNEIYIGIAANDSLSQCSPSEKVVILEHCREFDFKDDIYTLVDIVNPKIAQSFKPNSLSLFQKLISLIMICKKSIMSGECTLLWIMINMI